MHADEPRHEITLRAPAKVNLGLRVAALRGDGYHEIDTLFATTTLADRVTVTLTAAGISGTVRPDDGPGAADDGGRPTGDLPPMDARNLAWIAAETWLRESGHEGGVRIDLVKAVPVAAGLGGGSSDAAAVLRALQALVPDGPAATELAGRIGSDVPFFATGWGAGRGRGRGERLTEVDLPAGHLVLVEPGVAIAAADAYAALQNFGPPLPPEATVDALRRGLPPSWRNDLQPGVLRAHPVVRDALVALREQDLVAPVMSGSGGTCFALARDAEHAEACATSLRRDHPDWWCRAVAFPAPEAG